jgi:8-oxo-dGTP pyrophosphatase MutT (NUDIX family)
MKRTARELRALIERRLEGTHPPTDPAQARLAGLTREMDPMIQKFLPRTPLAAAVLVPIVDHGDELTVLLTQRSAHLRNHAGQVSFPGGRIESTDGGPLNAALRETEEEIGLSREFIDVAGFLDPQLILSGFWIAPVVGFIRPGFDLRLDHKEVDSTFEVPLEYILDPANHIPRERAIGEIKIEMHDIQYQDRLVWGATAAMLMLLYRLITFGGEA